MITRRLLLSAPAVLAKPALAQAPWPDRPIRYVVPWPPGGLNDMLARHFNDRVGQRLGRVIVNDFRAGAGGRVGVAEIARAQPDGYTIGMGNLGPLTIFPQLFPDLQYDVARDLAPVVMFCASPLVLIINKDLPVTSVAALIALAKAQPGKLNYGSIGIGSAQHLIFEMFAETDGIRMEHIPYRGAGDSQLALIGNDIQAMFETLPTALPMIRDGRVRALAVTTPGRVPQLPDLPTLAEAGQKGIEVVTWYGTIAPARTPDAILDRLHDEYVAVSNLPETKALLDAQGLIFLPNTRAAFTARIAAEGARWKRLIADRNIRVT